MVRSNSDATLDLSSSYLQSAAILTTGKASDTSIFITYMTGSPYNPAQTPWRDFEPDSVDQNCVWTGFYGKTNDVNAELAQDWIDDKIF